MNEAVRIRAVPQPSCPMCGSDGRLLYENLTDELFSAPGVWCLKKCCSSACGGLWLDPVPEFDDLGAAYETYYTHVNLKGLRRLRSLAMRFATSLPLLPFGIIRERRDSSLMYLDDVRPGTLLDVGCGNGEFLARMRDLGWRVEGLDFDPAAASVASERYGINVHVGTLEEVAGSGKVYDAVTASHVIEHVPNPGGFLADAIRLVAPGGRVVIKTPNADSFGHERFGRNWRGLEPPRHLQLFTPRGLQRLIEQLGLRANVWTSAGAAEYILHASHFLKEVGHYRPDQIPSLQKLKVYLIRIFYAIRAQMRVKENPLCGEEICAIVERAVQ